MALRRSSASGLSVESFRRGPKLLNTANFTLESFDAEKRIEQLEALLEAAGKGRLIEIKANG